MAIVFDRRASARASSVAPNIGHGRLWLSFVLIAFLALGLIFKSFMFVDGEPVAINYIFNGLFIVAMLIGLTLLRSLVPIGKHVVLLFAFAILWAAMSSWVSGIAMNYVATFSMLVLLAGCFYAVPVACMATGIEPWRLVNALTVITVILSALMLYVTPGSTVDPESGRFSGFFISVAVACNFFFFGTALNAAAALHASTTNKVYLHAALAILSFVLMYMTRTRNVLIETLFVLIVLAAFSPLRRGPKMFVMAIMAWVLLFGIASGTAVSTGLVSIDEQLREFRLADRSLMDARNRNWEFGLLRIAERPIFGEGLLTKQTEGGTRDIDLGEGGSYNQAYDPHSLPLSLAVQGGLPFMLAIMATIVLVFARFIKRFGLVRSLQSPDFVIAATHVPVMMLAGGDLTTMGNMVEKVFWVLLGSLELKNSLVAPGDPRYQERLTLKDAFSSQRNALTARPAG